MFGYRFKLEKIPPKRPPQHKHRRPRYVSRGERFRRALVRWVLLDIGFGIVIYFFWLGIQSALAGV